MGEVKKTFEDRCEELINIGLQPNTDGYTGTKENGDINFHCVDITCDTDEEWNTRVNKVKKELERRNSLLKIEGKEVTEEHVGNKVTHIPPHADGNVNHKDCRSGKISSFNNTYVFVRFHSPNGQACKPENLIWG